MQARAQRAVGNRFARTQVFALRKGSSALACSGQNGACWYGERGRAVTSFGPCSGSPWVPISSGVLPGRGIRPSPWAPFPWAWGRCGSLPCSFTASARVGRATALSCGAETLGCVPRRGKAGRIPGRCAVPASRSACPWRAVSADPRHGERAAWCHMHWVCA